MELYKDTDVLEFYTGFEEFYEQKLFCHIHYEYKYFDEERQKWMKDNVKNEKNTRSLEDIKKNRENKYYEKYNGLSLSLSDINDLCVVDFDKKLTEGECELYDILHRDNCVYTTTKNGTHFYVMIKNLPPYTAENKIYIDKNIDVDLLAGGKNVWEHKDRKVNGIIINYSWDDIKKYFDINKMNFITSPPVSEQSSPSVSDEDECGFIEEPDEMFPTINKKEFDKKIKSFIPRYERDDWIKVGFVCYNNFIDDDEVGLKFFQDYSKNDKKAYKGQVDVLNTWLSFRKGSSTQKKISYKLFDKWRNEDNPSENKYENWYYDGTLVKNMNNECVYYVPSAIIIFINNNICHENKKMDAKTFFGKYEFDIEEGKKKKQINPFDIWIKASDRRDVDKIVFNPYNNHKKNEFNRWTGFNYENTGLPNMDKLQYWLNHIKTIWADNDEKTYEYILNWFARIFQTPHKKNNVCLVLHSVEGVGKTMILNMIGKLMGDSYYHSTSNLDNVIGRFNKDGESKLLMNLNETNWGGDKKMVGAFKEFITDDTIVINKKGKDQYTIKNYCNTIITTNSEWIVAIDKNDRRFNLRECSSTKHDDSYYKLVANTDLQEIANFLYNRDLKGYDPREFIKSDLHRQQIVLNFDSVEEFYGNLITGEIEPGFDITESMNKETIYNLYKEKTINNGYNLLANNKFWQKIRKITKCYIIKGAKKKGQSPQAYINNLDEALEEWKYYTGEK